MRKLVWVVLSGALNCGAGMAWAERIEVGFETVDVTLYPDRAQVERIVTFDAAAGRHELVVPNLPPETPAEAISLSLPEGVTVVSSLLSQGRLPVTGLGPTPETLAAQGEIDLLDRAIAEAEGRVAEILLAQAAAEEQIRFLRGLGAGVSLDRLSPERLEDIRSLNLLVGELALEAETQAHQARQGASMAERAITELLEDRVMAQQALDALVVDREGGATLSLRIDVAEGGELQLGITTLTLDAYWLPTYDIALNSETGQVDMDRGVIVGQSSGEDWWDVGLTLSTARPGDQNEAGQVWPSRRSIISHEEIERRAALESGGVGGFATDIVEPPVVVVTPAERAAARSEYHGMTVVYVYPEDVDLRDGVDSLRLDLGPLNFDAELRAEAVPARDDTAFLMAEFENTGGEILLPGPAVLYRDGALVGMAELPLTPVGGEVALGFGPIDGLRLGRDVIRQSEGEIGLITASNQQQQQVVMTVENLTDRPWDVTVRDGFAYSEQDDLVIEWQTMPEFTRAAPDNRRGVLEWDIVVAPNSVAQIDVLETLNWPEGYDLR